MVRKSLIPWFKKHSQLLEAIKQDIASEHKDLLIIVNEDSKVVIRGTLPLVADGIIVDRYQIKLIFPDDYPKTPPKLFEVGGRTPHIADRHINTKDGSACLFIPDEQSKFYSSNMKVTDYIKGAIRDFFLWQTEFELGINPIAGRTHGVNGRLEFYKEVLKTDDPRTILESIKYLSKDAKGHWLCFCGSGKAMRKCHNTEWLQLRKTVNKETALDLLETIRKGIKDKK